MLLAWFALLSASNAFDLTLHVVDGETGAAVPDVKIGFFSGENWANYEELTSDAAGHVQVPEKPDDWDAYARVVTPGYISQTLKLTKSRFSSNFLKLTIVSQPVTKARILAPDGTPIVGAKITLSAGINKHETARPLRLFSKHDMLFMANWGTLLTSDQNGEIQITAPDAADTAWSSLTCEAEGYPITQIDDALNVIETHRSTSDEPWDFVVKESVLVRGRVVDSDGEPLANMAVVTRDDYGRWPKLDLGVSDENGYLAELAMAPGLYRFLRPSKDWPDERARVIPVSELELPFREEKFQIPEGKEKFEITFKARPSSLYQFDWEERRQNPSGRRKLILGGVELRNCELEDGIERMCAHLEKEPERTLLRRDLGENSDSVFYFESPSGNQFPLNETYAWNLNPLGDRKLLGKIVAEDGAQIEISLSGAWMEQLSNFCKIKGIVTGRFKKREVTLGIRDTVRRRGPRVEKGTLINLFPGESIKVSIAHRTFETIGFGEKDLKAGERRARKFRLVAKKPLLEVNVMETGKTYRLPNYRLLVGVPNPKGAEGELMWYREALHQFNGNSYLWKLHKGYDKILIKAEADGYVSKTTDWLDGSVPEQSVRIFLEREKK